jgi:hypothetical protein
VACGRIKANKVVEMEILDSISRVAIGTLLNPNTARFTPVYPKTNAYFLI